MATTITTKQMDFDQDFATVDLILKTDYETRGVDAFILSFIKCEKQARRLFTYLVFQNPSYTSADYSKLRSTLSNNRRLYFRNFINGINLISPRPLAEIYGADYQFDYDYLIQFANDRNKIFHGQVTLGGLSRQNLFDRIFHIKKWCKNLGEKMATEIGFDGFNKSYIKSSRKVAINNLNDFDTVIKYEHFLNTI